MQISDEHVVVVGVVVVRLVVVVRGGVVVVVVVVVDDLSVVVVVVVVVVAAVAAVVVVVDDDDCDTELTLVVVGPADCVAGGIGSTAPNSDGSRSDASSPRVPKANRVQTIAPTTAPTARRPCPLPCPLCRVDPIGVLRVRPATTAG